MKAAEMGHTSIVKVLLGPETVLQVSKDVLKAAGVDAKELSSADLPLLKTEVDAKDDKGQTALFRAAANYHQDAVATLLEAGQIGPSKIRKEIQPSWSRCGKAIATA